MPIVHHVGIVPILIMLLLPVMTLFALPLACSMAVHTVFATHKERDELVVFSFLPRAKQAVRVSVGVFALLAAVLYASFVFYLAPAGYVLSKRLFFNAAKDQFLHVKPGVFHAIIPTLSFYVQKKRATAEHETYFEQLMLAVRKKNNEQFFITASQGFFDEQSLVLEHGYIFSFKGLQLHSAFFKKTVFHLDSYLIPAQDSKIFIQNRFLTVAQLWDSAIKNNDARFELHKRLAQTCWQFVLVLLAFSYAILRRKSTLLICVLMSGVSFLATYLIMSLAQGYVQHPALALAFLYAPLLIGFGFSMNVIFNRWEKR
jgi:lipopolysaccharide export LptBFGC system permease protein LptF